MHELYATPHESSTWSLPCSPVCMHQSILLELYRRSIHSDCRVGAAGWKQSKQASDVSLYWSAAWKIKKIVCKRRLSCSIPAPAFRFENQRLKQSTSSSCFYISLAPWLLMTSRCGPAFESGLLGQNQNVLQASIQEEKEEGFCFQTVVHPATAKIITNSFAAQPCVRPPPNCPTQVDIMLVKAVAPPANFKDNISPAEFQVSCCWWPEFVMIAYCYAAVQEFYWLEQITIFAAQAEKCVHTADVQTQDAASYAKKDGAVLISFYSTLCGWRSQHMIEHIQNLNSPNTGLLCLSNRNRLKHFTESQGAGHDDGLKSKMSIQWLVKLPVASVVCYSKQLYANAPPLMMACFHICCLGSSRHVCICIRISNHG